MFGARHFKVTDGWERQERHVIQIQQQAAEGSREQRGLPPSTLQLLQAAGHSSSGRTDRREHTYVLRAERKNKEAVLRGGLGGGTTDTSTNISKKEG